MLIAFIKNGKSYSSYVSSFTADVMYNYDYEEYSDAEDGNGDRLDEGIPRSEIDWFDARSRRRRDTEQSDQNAVVYSVCVRSVQRNFTLTL